MAGSRLGAPGTSPGSSLHRLLRGLLLAMMTRTFMVALDAFDVNLPVGSPARVPR
jgi:hypothetical protein